MPGMYYAGTEENFLADHGWVFLVGWGECDAFPSKEAWRQRCGSNNVSQNVTRRAAGVPFKLGVIVNKHGYCCMR